MHLLEIKGLTKRFGGLVAVNNVSFKIKENEIIGLIGPNGAGKTTIFNMIAGTYKPSEGEVIYCGERITGKQTYEIARLGISRTFQNIRLFKGLTVAENTVIGGIHTMRSGLFDGMLNLPKSVKESEELWTEVEQTLKYLGIELLSKTCASNLPYGHQRLLEISRALVSKPKLLLLDEPTAGMNPNETEEVMELIRKLKDSGITILVIEHDMRLVMGVCERVVVLNYGQKIAEGTPEEIRTNPKVVEAYLGRDHKYA